MEECCKIPAASQKFKKTEKLKEKVTKRALDIASKEKTEGTTYLRMRVVKEHTRDHWPQL